MNDAPKPPGQSLEIDRVRKSYGPTQILRDFSLDVPGGSFCTLLGASGSGKTTLLKLIAGFETLDGGAIRLGGRDIGQVPVNRRNIGMVFQNYALFPHMSVRDNVAFGLSMRRVARAETAARVAEALEMVGLAPLAGRYPRQLSGGQQQRVALARALVIRPDLLLMDEPLGALDKNLRASLQSEIKRLQTRLGVTIVFVTHDQEEALHMSDLIVVLDGGRIEQVGSPQALYRRPANRFVASFLGDCNFVERDGRTFAVRPEELMLGPRVSDGMHRAAGVVEEATFLGAHLRVVVRSGGERLVALVPAAAEKPDLTVGRQVELGFAPADVTSL